MKTAVLNIEKVAGKNTVSRADGKVIYENIKNLWKTHDQIVINFGNLAIASVSFMDEAFGHFALEYGQEQLRNKLKLLHINEYDRALLNDIILSRVRQTKLRTHRKATKKGKIAVGIRLNRRRSK
jgi:hypothetical protein